MRTLVTGVSGFIGSHLCEYLINEKKQEVYGLCRWRSNRENLKNIINKINLIEGDLTDGYSMNKVIREVNPDYIYHLASQSYVQAAYNYPTTTMNINVNGTINLLEAVKSVKIDPVIVGISSSEVYGNVEKENLPITEKTALNPANIYSVSKVAQDMILQNYHLSYGLKTIRIRNFTCSGSRRSDVFFASSFVKQLVAIKIFDRERVVKVGNLNSIRTLCHVYDMVKGYELAARKCTPGECYIISGEESYSVGEILQMIIDMVDLKDVKIKVEESLLRPNDITSQVADCSLFKRTTGWEPTKKVYDILIDLYNYWLIELRNNPWKSVTVI